MRQPATNVGLRDSVERSFDRLAHRLACPGLRAAPTRFALRPTRRTRLTGRRRGRPPAEPRAPRRPLCFSPGPPGGRPLRPQPAVPRVPGRPPARAAPALQPRAMAGAVNAPRSLASVQAQSGATGLLGPRMVGPRRHDAEPEIGRAHV